MRKQNLLLVSVVTAGLLVMAGSVSAQEEGKREKQIAEQVAKIMTGARKVVSGWQETINNPNLGDKGFTPEVFAEEASRKIREDSGIDVNSESLAPEVKAMWEAMKAVITEAQPVINKRGTGYKGFVPAVFARQASGKWGAKVPGVYAKLTTVATVHNPVNKPDDWEKGVLDQFRANPDYNNRQPYYEVTTFKGSRSLRLIQPEYFVAACLNCHGKPEGEKGPGGIIKCGQEEGAGGSGFSIALPIQ